MLNNNESLITGWKRDLGEPQHLWHEYHVVCSDLVIVRWCLHCGVTDRMVRYGDGGSFPSTWTRIHEASQ